MRLSVFDHADNYLFDVKDGDVFECLRTEEINGEHSLSITTVTRLQQSQRIVVGDGTGTWREYVVTGVDELHSTGKRAVGTYYCVWSLQHDLSVVYGDDVEVGGETPAAAHVAMTAALTGTRRWTLGTVNVSGTATIEMFGNFAWERVGQVVSAYGGEVESRVTVDPVHGVTGRSVSLKAMVGATRVTRRFDWGSDATSIRRKPPEGARVCRIIPVGSGDDVTIADVNDGVRYLEDPEAKAAFRLPDGSGGWEYPTSVVRFDTDDDRVLLEKATRHLHDYTRPVPTYEASVLQYAEAGADMRGVNLGDPVNIVDRGFNPSAPLRLEARVVKVVTNLLDPADVQLTVGAIGAHLADYFRALDSRMQAVQTRLDAMWKEGGATPTTAEYVEWLMKQMSDRVNASGGYVYHVPGYGIRTYDKAVTDPLVGAEASKVVALTGGGIVFANSKTPSGDWIWKTVIESGHIATELVTGGRITTGYIGNPVSGNYWNLDTGQVRMSSGTAFVDGDGNALTFEGLVTSINDDIDGLQDQIDGNITTWFYEPEPTASNAPAKDWNTAAKKNEHLGDLYYSTASGYCWRWMKDGSSYGWQRISDTDVAKALSDAAKAQDTADHKRRVFVSQPKPPYDVGDLWAQGASGEIMRCKTARASGSYVASDWEKASKYTDDSYSKEVERQLAEDIAAVDETATNAAGDVSLLKKGSTNSVDVEYGTSSSASVKPTSWSTSATVWKRGKYLWTRQKMTMYNGMVKYSAARLLANQSGIGVSKATEQYYLSRSKVNLSGGSWADRQQPYKSGWYYFTRTRILWSDGTVTYDPSASGELAQAFTSVNDIYDARLDQKAVFNKLTNKGRSQGLFTDKDGNYYFNATYMRTGVLSDLIGRNYWNLNTGEFKLSSVAALEEKVDAIKVGGENLVNGTADWAGWKKTGNFAVSGEIASSAARASITTANQWANAMQSPAYVHYGKVRGRELTVSFEMKTTSSWGAVGSMNDVCAILCLCAGDGTGPGVRQRWRNFSVRQAPTTSWKRVSFTVDCSNGTFTGGTAAFSDSHRLALWLCNHSGKQLSIRRVKVEVGNVATDWSASSRDVELTATAKANKALKDSKDYTGAEIKKAKTASYTAAKNYADNISDADRKYTNKQRKDLDDSFTHAKIFNRLTQGGLAQGIYSQGVDASGKAIARRNGRYVTTPHHYDYYFNATYIQTGTLDAKVIKAGVIAPKGTASGDFKMNMQTGYILTRNMEAQNIHVKGGSVDVSSNGYALRLASGRLTGYKNGKWVGFIDPTSEVDIYDQGRYVKTVNGLQITTTGSLRISSPRIDVMNTSNTGKSTIVAYTGWVKLDKICTGKVTKNINGADDTTLYTYTFDVPKNSDGKIHLHFINGLLVEWKTNTKEWTV